jgi:hypothetical protein
MTGAIRLAFFIGEVWRHHVEVLLQQLLARFSADLLQAHAHGWGASCSPEMANPVVEPD